MAKGAVPVLTAFYLGTPEGVAALCGFCAFLGHLYPLFFSFRGGKGVATALGMIGALHWPTLLLVATTWLLVLYLTRISSVAAIISFLAAPIYTLFTQPTIFFPILVLSLFLLMRHYHNIAQLIRGEEQRIQ